MCSNCNGDSVEERLVNKALKIIGGLLIGYVLITTAVSYLSIPKPVTTEVGSTPRSPKWETVRRHYIKSHGECEACGARTDLNVHHIRPFHLFPELELSESNLITLCRKHHFELGHKKDWSDYDVDVRAHAAELRKSLPIPVILWKLSFWQ